MDEDYADVSTDMTALDPKTLYIIHQHIRLLNSDTS